MSYPPPPGSSNAPPSSLPPRPPPSKFSGFKPAFSPAGTPPTHTPSPGAGRSTPYTAPPATYSGAHHYGAPPTTTSSSYQSNSYTPHGQMSGGGGRGLPQSSYASSYQQQGGYQQNYYGAQPLNNAPAAYSAAPQIRNPFPTPAQASKNDDYDPDMAAQIAQWQSAYVKDPAKDGPVGTNNFANSSAYIPGRPGNSMQPPFPEDPAIQAANAAAAAAPVVSADGKKKTVVRTGGGQKWTDDTLLEWDPSHLRLFVGNLAGETTDESLYKAFSRWKSLQKARVIRDKVTSKSKGFGFVSFSDPDEFFAAAKEMNGRYIQSHPVVVRKSTTEIKTTNVKDKRGGHNGNNKHHNKNKNNRNNNKNNNDRNGNGGGAGGNREGGASEPKLGPTGGGVHKPGQKTKGGLRILG